MAKTDFGSLAKWVVIGGIAYFLIKGAGGFSEWLNNLLKGKGGLGNIIPSDEDIAASKNSYFSTKELMPLQYEEAEKNNAQLRTQEFTPEYAMARINEYTKWIHEERVRISNANNTKTLYWYNEAITLNQDTIILDAETRINIYTDKIEIFKGFL